MNLERGLARRGHVKSTHVGSRQLRRLSKDYEYSEQTSETLIAIASTRLILHYLANIL
jgi:hypothetical protein